MRYVVCTDIHLNFVDKFGWEKFIDEVLATDLDCLFITGDISEGNILAKHLEILHLGIKKPIYFVCGNHDFYLSSTERVRADLVALQSKVPDLHYMRRDPVKLSPYTQLVGVDGWADARIGFPESGRVVLADWNYIADYKDEFAHISLPKRLEIAQKYGDTEAAILDSSLSKAEETGATKIIVLTHVPPFKGATWHKGKISDGHWLPWFSCHAVGQTLNIHAVDHPNIEYLVYTGHTHGGGLYRHRKNLVVKTNSAEYNYPGVACVGYA